MDQQISIILNQVGVFGILMSIGYVFMKTKILNTNTLKGVSALLMKLLMPITTFYVVYDSGATIELFIENSLYFMIVLILFLSLIGIGMLFSKGLKMQNAEAIPFILYFAFANNNFFGLPILTSLFSSAESSINFTQNLIVDSVLLWTLGIYLCTRHLKQGNFLQHIKKSVNAMTLAVMIAFVMVGLNIQLPSVLDGSLIGFKQGSSSIAMFYVGCLLAEADLSGIFKDVKLYVLVFVKMIALPILILLFLKPMLGEESALVLAILMGLPGKVMITIMVGTYELNDYYAAKLVFATTIVALVTIPMIIWVNTLLI